MREIDTIINVHLRPWSDIQLKICAITTIVVVALLVFIRKKYHTSLRALFGWLCMYGYIWLVLGSTVFTRSAGTSRAINLDWFYTWEEIRAGDMLAKEQVILNVILFVPFGVSLGLITWKKMRPHKAFLLGLALSLVVEISQYITMRGLFEGDDLIHNTLGCVLGYMVMMVVKVVVKVVVGRFERKK